MFNKKFTSKSLIKVAALSAIFVSGSLLSACGNALDNLTLPEQFTEVPNEQVPGDPTLDPGVENENPGDEGTENENPGEEDPGDDDVWTPGDDDDDVPIIIIRPNQPSDGDEDGEGDEGEEGGSDENPGDETPGEEVSSDDANGLCFKNPVWCAATNKVGANAELITSDIVSAYTDKDEGKGSSGIFWPVDSGEEGFIDKMVTAYGGLYFDYYLLTDRDNLPYVGVQFNVTGKPSNSQLLTDITKWEGVCVKYKSNSNVTVKIGLPKAIEESIGHNNHEAVLPASKDIATQCIEWESFLQPKGTSDKQKFALKSALTIANRIMFEVHDRNETSGTIGITSIGKYADNK